MSEDKKELCSIDFQSLSRFEAIQICKDMCDKINTEMSGSYREGWMDGHRSAFEAACSNFNESLLKRNIQAHLSFKMDEEGTVSMTTQWPPPEP